MAVIIVLRPIAATQCTHLRMLFGVEATCPHMPACSSCHECSIAVLY